MKAAWARGLEWWQQHGHTWELAWFSWTLFAVCASLSKLIPDFGPGYHASPFAGFLVAVTIWAFLYALSALPELFRSAHDFGGARAFPTGVVIVFGAQAIPSAFFQWIRFN